MKEKLRRKFILFAMAAVTVLLLILIGAINGLSRIQFDRQSDRVMKTLVEADGMFKQMEFLPPRPFDRPPDMDRMRSARFFIVRTDETGAVKDVNIDEIFSVTFEKAKELADTVLAKGKTSGRIERYKYTVKNEGSEKLIFFLDISNDMDTLLTVLWVSCLIALICWALVLVFVSLLSGRVVEPIAAGIEKQKRFITDAGHELKTPLAIIQSNNDAMSLIHGENKYNRNIQTQIRRLNVLMTNLLTMAKLDEEMIMQAEDVDLSALADETAAAFQNNFSDRSLNFTSHIEPDIHIQSNRDSMTQLLTTLMDNASKYTPEGGEIHLALVRESGHALITLENTCSVPENPDPERLFERFYRGDPSRSRQSADSGYGIGLSAARSICENFGGTLKAEYISGNSIRFTARF